MWNVHCDKRAGNEEKERDRITCQERQNKDEYCFIQGKTGAIIQKITTTANL
jgi:hypothetical protein